MSSCYAPVTKHQTPNTAVSSGRPKQDAQKMQMMPGMVKADAIGCAWCPIAPGPSAIMNARVVISSLESQSLNRAYAESGRRPSDVWCSRNCCLWPTRRFPEIPTFRIITFFTLPTRPNDIDSPQNNTKVTLRLQHVAKIITSRFRWRMFQTDDRHLSLTWPWLGEPIFWYNHWMLTLTHPFTHKKLLV